MNKIISLFQRNYDGDRLVRDEVVSGAEWVVAGEGVATRKYDGTSCMIKDDKLYKRLTIKNGAKVPEGFIPCTTVDPDSKKLPGWIPVTDEPSNKWHLEGFAGGHIGDGTYELVGPKVRANPEPEFKDSKRHFLLPHSDAIIYMHCPRTFEELKCWFIGRDIEGVVWHHKDGRMVKIKKTDFGLKRKDLT